MHKGVFSKAYIIASCIRLVNYQHTLVCVAVFISFSYCVFFFQDVYVRCFSFLTNLLELVAQRFVVFCHEDDVWVLIKGTFYFLAKLLYKFVKI